MTSSKFFFLLGLCFLALTLVGTCIDANEVIPPHTIYKLLKKDGLTYLEKVSSPMPFNICEIKAGMMNQAYRDKGGKRDVYVCFDHNDIDAVEVKK